MGKIFSTSRGEGDLGDGKDLAMIYPEERRPLKILGYRGNYLYSSMAEGWKLGK